MFLVNQNACLKTMHATKIGQLVIAQAKEALANWVSDIILYRGQYVMVGILRILLVLLVYNIGI